MDNELHKGFYYCITCKNIAKVNCSVDDIKCSKCGSVNCAYFPNRINLPDIEIDVIKQISTDHKFWNAMIQLKENNIIDYELKMNQFREQIERQKKSYDDVPHCPKCGSTSITTGARGVNFTWGLLGASKTVNRCSNCGHTWKPKK